MRQMLYNVIQQIENISWLKKVEFVIQTALLIQSESKIIVCVCVGMSYPSSTMGGLS